MDAGELEPDARVSNRYESQARNVAKQAVARALQALAAEGRFKRFLGHGYIVMGWCPSCRYQYTSDGHKQTCGQWCPGRQESE